MSLSDDPEMTAAQHASEGRKGLGKVRAYRGYAEGSREVPMVRTPADPLGSRTPSHGRSQRRDTDRGPVDRSMHASTHGSSSSKAGLQILRLSRALSPKVPMYLFKSPRTRPFWCRFRPVAPRTRGLRSFCRCSLRAPPVIMGYSGSYSGF